MKFIHICVGWLLAAALALSGACTPKPAAGTQATTAAAEERPPTLTMPEKPPRTLIGTDAPETKPEQPQLAATVSEWITPGPGASCRLEVCVGPGQFLLSRPIAPPGRVVVDPSYRYGSTQNGAREPHHGVEFLNSSGTPVLAAAAGQVVVSGNDRETIYAEWPYFYGNLVILEHDLPELQAPVFTLYAHLAEVQVSVGEWVEPGQQIGLVGLTGVATGSHLHFEVRVGDNRYSDTRNPELWLQPLVEEDGQPAGALAGRITDGRGQMVYLDNLVLERLVGPNRSPVLYAYLETYADPSLAGDSMWEETFALSDLTAGWYRLTFVYRGLQSIDFEVQPGMLTLVTLRIDDEATGTLEPEGK